jgi:hypothetical protein
MSSYTNLKVVELRELCKAAGLSSSGRKADLIASLQEKDRRQLQTGSQVTEVDILDEVESVDAEESEVVIADQSEDIRTESVATSCNEITALKLKLELARENRLALEIKERMHLNMLPTQNGATSLISANIQERELRGLLPKMSEHDDDVISFFHAFERTLELYEVDVSCYARLLPSCLSVKAAKVYAKLSLEQSKQYATVKREILTSFKLDAASYLQKFRAVKRAGSESYKLFGNRLQELQSYYFESKDISSFETLKADMLLEQFISTLPPDVKAFVLARRATNIDEASDFADLAFQVSVERNSSCKARQNFKANSQPHQSVQINATTEGQANAVRTGNDVPKTVNKQIAAKASLACFECGGPHKKLQCPKLKEKATGNAAAKVVTCFTCGGKGHKSGSALCKGKVDRALQETYHVNVPVMDKRRENRFVIPTFVNGVKCSALRDTGASCSLVNLKTLRDCVMPIEGRCMMIRGVIGQQTIPVADVRLYSPHFKCDKQVTVTVGLVDNMEYDLLLGNDIFIQGSELVDVVSMNHLQQPNSTMVVNSDSSAHCINAVTTRSQARNVDGVSASVTAEQCVVDASHAAGSRDNSSDCEISNVCRNKQQQTAVSEPSNDTSDIPMHSAEGQNVSSSDNNGCASIGGQLADLKRPVSNSGDTKASDKSRVQVTAATSACSGNETLSVDTTVIEPLTQSDNPIEGAEPTKSKSKSRSEFGLKQQQDGSLKHLFDLAGAGSEKYLIEDGILYRRAFGAFNTTDEKLLVVPACYREQLIKTAHESMWAAHTGAKRIAQRVSALFFFPRMHSYITAWVKKCPVCQHNATIKTRYRVPLKEMPIINEVFADISIDVCGGDWPVTPRKNRYLLTAICNASKFAFAMPVPNLRAKTLAARLMKLFSSIGSPKTLRLDAAAQWRGSLTQELTRSLGIACKIATPFHHESIGALERFHFTLERMAKSFIHEHPTQWDIAIDFYLFAYNSVKSAATGYSPQELVFGRNLRSPLNVMREIWLNGEPEKPKLGKDALTYITELKEQLEAASEAAEAEMKRQGDRQKRIYDRKTTVREFKEGDLVLILQPTSSFKLLAQWAGPYPVTKKLNSFNYEIDLGHRKTILHINLLRKWEERVETVNVITINEDLVDGEEKILDSMGIAKEPKTFNVGGHLSIVAMTSPQRIRRAARVAM